MPQLATFEIGEKIYAIDILLTKEIGRMHDVTKVPQAPPYIQGLMNLRGQILTIIDPTLFLSNNRIEDTEDVKIIILKTNNELDVFKKKGLLENVQLSEDPVALMISSVGDVINVNSDNIQDVVGTADSDQNDLISGAIQLETHLVSVLAIETLLKKSHFNEVVSN